MPKSIEEWIREIIKEEIDKKYNENENLNFFWKTTTINRSPAPPLGRAKYEDQMDSFSNYGPWGEAETEDFKKEINDFLISKSRMFGRSRASIKAKLLQILRQSYQKI